MISPIRAVLFDAVGTVLYPKPSAATAYYEAGRQFRSRLAAPEVARRYYAAFARHEARPQNGRRPHAHARENKGPALLAGRSTSRQASCPVVV